MAGRNANRNNWGPTFPETRYEVSGKNREFYTFENAPGLGNYATGGTIIDGGDGYIYHIFTGTGVFAIPAATPSARLDSVDYLIIAGGGGRTNATGTGGGGGGGLRQGTIPVSPSISYPVTVGAGGPSTSVAGSSNRNGTPSSVFSVVATAGGGGGWDPAGASPGAIGGSGGGGGTSPAGPVGNAGIGGPVGPVATIPYQGWDGSGAGYPGIGGGGGGAGGSAVGSGTGAGPGRIVSQFPAPIIQRGVPDATFGPLVNSLGYAAGGGGFPTPAPLSRTSPVGSGFGGTNTGYAGGSGIVCIRYKKTTAYSRATGGTIEPNTHPEHPGIWRHIFTSPGTFTVTDPTLQWIDYLAVGGGGGGGGGAASPGGGGGGGGAGGFVSSIHNSTTTPLAIPEAYPWNPGYSVRAGEQYPVGVAAYPVTIGIGGAGGIGTISGSPGFDTTIGSPGPLQIVAVGGGGGGYLSAGFNGGSGGGASKGFPSSTPYNGGTANPSPNIQGNSGGGIGSTESGGSAGGGGAGAVGASLVPLVLAGSAGGNGWYSKISPSAYGTSGPLTPTPEYRYFAGGGGGGGGFSPGPTQRPGGSGGSGGGGAGANMPSFVPSLNPAAPGTTNTGGGGGGGRSTTPSTGGSGGPGIVIIQYPE